MGPHTADVPKAFMDVAGRTLFDRQRAALDAHVDEVTVVLGYAAERARDHVDGARAIVLGDWRRYENAESLVRGLAGVDDDVFVLNGDIVVTESVVARVIDRHEATPTGRSVVGCIPGVQEEATAIQCDEDGRVTEYGLVPGHRHAGLGIVDATHVDAARRYLRDHRDEWYPGLYTAVDTEMVAIPADHHIEINYPQDKLVARNKLPLGSADELDLST